MAKRLQQENKYQVGARKWRNWPDLCQRVFNQTYESINLNQLIIIHPGGEEDTPEHWDTVAWNAAWLAADACQKGLKDIIKGKGYYEA